MTKYIENWVYKLKIQYVQPVIDKPTKYIKSVFSTIGGIYTVSEIEEKFLKTHNVFDILENSNIFLGLFIIFIFYVLYHRKKDEVSYHLDKKDISIRLKLSDILKINNSAIVIPTNTTFDTTMHDSFISEKSIQGKFQKLFYEVDFAELDSLIQNSLDEQYPNPTDFEILDDRDNSKRKRYKIGTVAKITKNKVHYYFLAVADVNKKGKPENVSMENVTQSLGGLWDYLIKDGNSEQITIPVICTGRAGLKDGNLEDVVRETIFSFIITSREEFIAKGLTVCIFPLSLKEANVTWDKLCEYLKAQCAFSIENSKRIKRLLDEGKPVD